MTQTICVVARVKAKSGRVSEMKEVLIGLLAPTRSEPGCIHYELLENRADPSEFTFIEEWRDAESIQAHFAKDYIQKAIGRLPEIGDGDLDLRQYNRIG